MYWESVVHKVTLNVAHKGYVMNYIYTVSFNQIQYTLNYPDRENNAWITEKDGWYKFQMWLGNHGDCWIEKFTNCTHSILFVQLSKKLLNLQQTCTQYKCSFQFSL
jgi:hypothetical protein